MVRSEAVPLVNTVSLHFYDMSSSSGYVFLCMKWLRGFRAERSPVQDACGDFVVPLLSFYFRFYFQVSSLKRNKISSGYDISFGVGLPPSQAYPGNLEKKNNH